MALRYYILIQIALLPILLRGQMVDGLDTLFGNEWIDYSKDHFSVSVNEDGVYRIDYQTLVSNGFPIDQVPGNQLTLFQNGKECPIYVSTDGVFGPTDYIEFLGRKNDGEIDRFLYEEPSEMQLHPGQSLFHDERTYYLTWRESSLVRLEIAENVVDSDVELETFFWERIVRHFTDELIQDYQLFGNVPVNYSSYDLYEGFSTGFVGEKDAPYSLNIEQEGLVSEVTEPSILTSHFVGNHDSHRLEIRWNGVAMDSSIHEGFQRVEFITELESESVLESNSFQFEGLNGAQDKHALSYIELRYPRDFVFTNKTFHKIEFEPTSLPKRVLIQGMGNGILSIINNQTGELKRISYNSDLDGHEWMIGASSVSNQYFLVSEEGISSLTELQHRDFQDLRQGSSGYIMIYHPEFLSDPVNQGANWVEAYASYRSSENGGSHDVAQISIVDVICQFGYGQKNHPIAIRNFIQYMSKHWDEVEYVFLIGKARDYADSRGSSESSQLYIPTWGSPGADNLLAAAHGQETPLIPCSRLAISKANELKGYLEKVKAFEAAFEGPYSIESRAWTKRVCHLSGGEEEADIIFPLFKSAGELLRDSDFGAEVSTFHEGNSNVQLSLTEQVINSVNEGTAIKTFFGHGAVNSTDFGIDNVQVFNNASRFPLSISLGCLSGNLHTEIQSLSEQFTLAHDRGSIAYMASSGFGFISSLRDFVRTFYGQLGGDHFGASLGVLLQESIRVLDSDNSIGMRTLMEQMTLNGDPALRLHVNVLPDYVADTLSVHTEKLIYSIQDNEVLVNFDLYNLGKSVNDSLDILVKHKIPGFEQATESFIRLASPRNRTEVTLKLGTYGKASAGLNEISVYIDPNNEIPEGPVEIAESNNQFAFDFLVIDQAMTPVFPEEYSIQADPNLSLIASGASTIEEETEIEFQIDTTTFFNSPSLKSTIVKSEGGVISWKPEIDFEEERVYYWRVRGTTDSTEVWRGQSFRFSTELASGWNQSHFHQFASNEFEGMRLGADRIFRFDSSSNLITITSVSSTGAHLDRSSVFFNTDRIARFIRFGPTDDNNGLVMAVVLDEASLEPWINPPFGRYGSVNSGSERSSFFFNTTTAEQRRNLITFLTDTIPLGSHVLLFAGQWDDFPYYPELWESDDTTDIGTNLFSVLEAQGAQEIRGLKERGSVPFIFAYQKGQGVYSELIADSISQSITSSFQLSSPFDIGRVITSLQGPINEPERLTWRVDSSSSDVNRLNILGYRHPNSAPEIIFNDTSGHVELSQLFNELPYFRLEWQSSDSVFYTASQLLEWYISGGRAGDFAFNPALNYSCPSDSLAQGESLRLEVAVQNIGAEALDSLVVRYFIQDEGGNQLEYYETHSILAAKDSLSLTVDTGGLALSGDVALTIELNPGAVVPEEVFTNNYLIKSFFIQRDDLRPNLDVLFDGKIIKNFDVVSPSAKIDLVLTDQGESPLLTDSSLISFALYDSDGQILLLSSQGEHQFSAAIEGDNQARLTLNLPNLQAAVYRLVAQGRDMSGNFASDEAYEVWLQVVDEESLVRVSATPNPFSDRLQFDYDLLGRETPETFSIKLYDSQGKLMHTIDQGNATLSIGSNRCLVIWDESKLSASSLPNGSYFFEFVIRFVSGQEDRQAGKLVRQD